MDSLIFSDADFSTAQLPELVSLCKEICALRQHNTSSGKKVGKLQTLGLSFLTDA